MTNLQAGQQYLVTNIKFTNRAGQTIQSGKQRIDDFKVPADVNDIQGWLDEYGHEVSDKTAYEMFVRAVLFYNYNMTYDFQLIKELPVPAVFQFGYITMPDLADMKHSDNVKFTTAIVDINVPALHLSTLCADDVMFADNDIEQAIFENLMHNMPIDINVPTITDFILSTMLDHMHEKDASSPDNIAQAALDSYPANVLSDQKENELYDAIVSLAHTLVKDIGKYL